MGKITINELDESLIEMLGNGGSNQDISMKQDKEDTALNTADNTIVGAINEINGLVSANSTYISNLRASIGERGNLTTTYKDNLVGAINEIAEGAKSNGFAGSTGGVDINTSNITTQGSVIDDTYASHGKSYLIMTGDSNAILYSSELPDIKFGNYALCLRMKIGAESTEDLVRVSLLSNGTNIAQKVFNGSNFDNAQNYQYLYTTFQYNGDGSSNKSLIIRIETLPTSSKVEIRFDYAYATMIMPSIFL